MRNYVREENKIAVDNPVNNGWLPSRRVFTEIFLFTPASLLYYVLLGLGRLLCQMGNYVPSGI